jgi:hypothetical protein
MIRIMRLLVLGLALLALGAPGAARADERVLARNQQEVNIHAYRGVAVFSLKQGSSYTLVASTAGGPPQPLNVPAQANVFDADIGRGRDGAPIVVVRLCAGATCTLNLLGLDGSPPVATGIEVPHGDVRPTVWDGTIAWYEHGRVRTKERTLARVEHGTRVLGLDLFGHELALNLDVSSPDAGVCGQRELRLVKFGAKHVRVLGSQLCGLNGQTFNGPAFDSGWLYFARACNTSCGASRFGTYRYRNGRYELAGSNRPLDDWAWGGHGSAYEVRAQDGVGCSDPDLGCTVVWRDTLRFKPVSAPVHS